MPAYEIDAALPEPASAPRSALLKDEDDDAIRVPRPTREERRGYAASGLYVGGFLVSALPLGDFDGEDALAGPTDLVLIPDLDVGAGAGAYVSYRWIANELILQYEVTEHDGEHDFTSLEHDTTFYNLDLNLRHYFWPRSPLQLYALAGVGWGRADIDNGSVDRASIEMGNPPAIVQDAELEDGININLGLGLALYTTPWVVFYGEGRYRFVRYGSSDGIDGTFDNIGDVDGDGWHLSAGAAIRLLPGRN